MFQFQLEPRTCARNFARAFKRLILAFRRLQCAKPALRARPAARAGEARRARPSILHQRLAMALRSPNLSTQLRHVRKLRQQAARKQQLNYIAVLEQLVYSTTH